MSREVRQGLASGSPSPMRDALKQWAFLYRGEMKNRFIKFARGGGDWPDLSESTKAGRRHGRGGNFKRGKRALAKARATGGGQISILIDRGQLVKVLTPRFKRIEGQSEKNIPFGIVVGFQGPGRKTDHFGKRTKATIREVAEYHHRGLGNIPKRELLVDPGAATQRKMGSVMENAIRKVVRDNQVPNV